jgi:hypothetical protein
MRWQFAGFANSVVFRLDYSHFWETVTAKRCYTVSNTRIIRY